jgi:glycosyltransferase involved in cell wall biosynthesis
MRILQLIDSLEAGGAERMAVNYANALTDEIAFSGLVATRKQGPLVEQLDEKVKYLFLKRKSTFDVSAVFRLQDFVKKNKVDVVHAHSSSFFLGVLLKIIYPKVQLIRHDHYGNSEFLDKRPSLILSVTKFFFSGVIVVNQQLKIWSQEKLKIKNCISLSNFYFQERNSNKQTTLEGLSGKRIVCLANLRSQKNHGLVLQVAKILKNTHSDWSFHLVGKDWEDAYSEKIKSEISASGLEQTVFLYGAQLDVSNILRQSTIGILTSKSEGLPVALLEYGWQQKPVVVTAVGEIPLVIQDGVNGFLVPSEDIELFYAALVRLIVNHQLQDDFGSKLYQTVTEVFSARELIKKYLNWLANNQE